MTLVIVFCNFEKREVSSIQFLFKTVCLNYVSLKALKKDVFLYYLVDRFP